MAAAAAAIVWLGAGRVPVARAVDRSKSVADVIPVPAQVRPGRGLFRLRTGSRVLTSQDPQAAQIGRYFAAMLLETRHIALEAVASTHDRPPAGAIVFALASGPVEADRNDETSSPDSYTIEVSPRKIVVSAHDRRGLFYGAVTLWQLCTARAPAAGAITVPAMRIVDTPRFRWRGLMLDSVRHFQSPEFVMRYIDWMALHKLNVLGWHLTDDQGWRLEIKKYPRLTEIGGWRVPEGRAARRDIDPATGQPRRYGGYYSQEDVRRIVAHAAQRYVTLVPEIDMPGHATAAIVAYPQLGVSDQPPQAVPSDWGIYPNLVNVEEAPFRLPEDRPGRLLGLFPG